MSAPLGRLVLPLVVFLTGASVLIVEVLAVRVLSPYYGNTIFTVSSVISVILLALSVGYYAGGTLADRRPSLTWFFSIILVSGLALLLLHVLGARFLPALSDRLSIELGPLVSATLLFLLPALLLGTISPFAIKLQSLSAPEQGVGRVAGAIFFWSTLGSITGSLLAGFVLIPNFGVDQILIATAVLLCALGFLPLLALGVTPGRLLGSLLVIVLVFGGAWSAGQAALRPSGVPGSDKIVYRKDGLYQKVTIYEGAYLGRPARFLLLDRSESGAMFLDSADPIDLVYDYTKYYRLYKIFTPRVTRALVLGGGAYSIPKALLSELPEAIVDVAEIEPSFFDLAKTYFGVEESPRLHNYVEDGRRFLHDAGKSYDLIFGDVYYSFFSVPPHFTTREFFALAKARLNTDGVFIANMIGDLSRQQPSLIMSEIKTFRDVFPNSYFFAVEARENTDLLQNITLVGYNSDRIVDVESPAVTSHPDPLIRFLRYKSIDIGRRFELSSYAVLTDDFSPVEYQTAQALRRSLDSRTVVDGDEMRAVVDQHERYGPARVGAPGHAKVRDFLRAEMEILAQEISIQSWKDDAGEGAELTNVIGRFSASEPRRVVLAAPSASAAGVAVALGLARMLVTSPVVPKVGVDLVFVDGPRGSAYFTTHLDELYGGSRPLRTIMLDEVCRSDEGEACSRTRLETAGQKVWNDLNAMR